MFTIKGEDYGERLTKNELLIYLYTLQKKNVDGSFIKRYCSMQVNGVAPVEVDC